MFATPLPPHDGFLLFCDQRCVDAWAADDPDDDLASRVAAVTDGPPWCLHCRACGARCWAGPACTLCPGCDQPRWSITSQAARFAAELGRYGIIHLPPNAYERGQTLCGYGLNPTFAAQVVLDLYRR